MGYSMLVLIGFCCIKVDQFVSYSQRLLGRRIFYTVGQVISVDPYQGWSGPWARVDEGGRLLEPRWSSAAILRHGVASFSPSVSQGSLLLVLEASD